jgi:hypothetical protein
MTENFQFEPATAPVETVGRPPNSLVTRHLPALRPLLRSNGSLACPEAEWVTVFLIGTPKRLEIAVTHRKQSSRLSSNRYKITGS